MMGQVSSAECQVRIRWTQNLSDTWLLALEMTTPGETAFPSTRLVSRYVNSLSLRSQIKADQFLLAANQ